MAILMEMGDVSILREMWDVAILREREKWLY